MEYTAKVELADIAREVGAEKQVGVCVGVLRNKGGSWEVELGAGGPRQKGCDGNACTTDDLWHLGSCGKAITGVLLAKLVDSGVLTYESTVGELLASENLPEKYHPVTLGRLLSHLGGVPGAPDDASWSEAWRMHCSKPLAGSNNPEECLTQEDRAKFLRMVLDASCGGEAECKYEYSNQGYVLAALMAERATGQSYEALVYEHVLGPLGISADFGIGAPGWNVDDDALRKGLPWGCGDQSGWQAKDPKEANADNPGVLTPAGRFHAKAAAWATLLRLFLDKEFATKRLALDNPDQTWAQLRKPFPGLVESNGYTPGGMVYALRAWASKGSTPSEVLTHAGSNTLNSCVCWLANFESDGREVAIFVCTNTGDLSLLDVCAVKLLQYTELI